MAVSLLLRGGRIRALKAVLLEARVFPGELVSVVRLSTESEKSAKEKELHPKTQSVLKDVGAEERGKLLTAHTAAALSKNSPPPSSYPSVENTGGAVAGPHPGGSLLPTDEGLPKHLSRKTLVAFPQKVMPPPQARGSDSKAQGHVQKVTNDSSSSSSSSSSDSDSDGEEHDSDRAPRVASKGKAGSSKPEASRPLTTGAPKITVSAKEKAKVQKPPTDVTYPEKTLQPKKKWTKPVEDSKEARSKPVTSRPQSSEMLEQNVKEEHQRGKPRPDKTGKESAKPCEAEGILPSHGKVRVPTQPTSGPVPTTQIQEASAEHPPAVAPRKGARYPEPKVPEPGWKTSSPLLRKESAEKQVPEGGSQVQEVLEDQKPVSYSKTLPVQEKDTVEESARPHLEGRFQVAVEAPPTDAVLPQEAPADTQGTPCLGSDSPCPLGCIDPKDPLEFLCI